MNRINNEDYSIVIPILFLLAAITVFIILIYTDRFEISNHVTSIDNKLSNIDNEFLFNVSSQDIENHSIINIFGENSQHGTNFSAVWELSNSTVYVFPTSGLIMTVNNVSTDNNAVIEINGLDESYRQITENITLATSVSTTKRFFRINSVVVISGNPSSDITIENNSITYAKINASTGKSQASIFTVPRGHNFYLYKVNCFTDPSFVKFRKEITSSNGIISRTDQTIFSNSIVLDTIPIKYPEKTDISLQLQTIGDAASIAPCSVYGQGILVKYI